MRPGQVRITITFENGKLHTEGNTDIGGQIAILEMAKFALMSSSARATPIAGSDVGPSTITAAPNFRPEPVA